MLNYRSLISSVILALFISTTGYAAEAPSASSMAAGIDGASLSGKVLETMNSGGYTYLQLDTEKGPVWVAIPQSQVEKGQKVACQPGAVMTNFPSKTLNRTFEAIVFSPGLVDGAAATKPQSVAAAQNSDANVSFEKALQAEAVQNKAISGAPSGPEHASGAMMTSGSSGAIVPSADVKVEKAEGENSYTIGELFEKAKELNDKSIRVRGKIVKISPMIMGKNWLHIQDGTGNPMKNSHDLVVTTMAEPAKDSIVTVEGVLHADRDFGFGYHYDVIIEDAAIK
jgi:hypothetical protein